MNPASEPDALEDALSEIVRAAQADIDGIRDKRGDAGELIERDASVTFILLVPGYSRRDIRVRAEADRLRVEAFDFKIERPLPCAVDPSTVSATYLNGVLSVRMEKGA
ncbi:MAG: Hsp20/alpha crystallin family protein [Nitrososphaerota archaeon]|nr:Hsp20/alpha crystallin family protein [Nitrososphaerota archaeon]